MTDAGRDPITESSFTDGTEDVSDEEDTDNVGLWLPIGPCGVVGAEMVRLSCRRCGVDWNAYGCTGVDAPLYV